jgi:hypothetical protein
LRFFYTGGAKDGSQQRKSEEVNKATPYFDALRQLRDFFCDSGLKLGCKDETSGEEIDLGRRSKNASCRERDSFRFC